MADWQPAVIRLMNSMPSQWSAEDLNSLSLIELSALAEAMGIARHGTKEKLRARIIICGGVREILAGKETVDDLVGIYKLKELQRFCRDVGCFIGSSKRMAAASLLNWRNRCRTNGQKAVRDAREEVARRPGPAQLRLF